MTDGDHSGVAAVGRPLCRLIAVRFGCLRRSPSQHRLVGEEKKKGYFRLFIGDIFFLEIFPQMYTSGHWRTAKEHI